MEHKKQIIRYKETLFGNIENPPVAPLVAVLRKEIGKEYEEIKESFIEIDGLRENDHSIRWMCYTVGSSAGPLKTITLMVSITIPKDNNISQLTASFEARPKCFERNILGNIGRFFLGETAKSLIGNFTINFKD